MRRGVAALLVALVTTGVAAGELIVGLRVFRAPPPALVDARAQPELNLLTGAPVPVALPASGSLTVVGDPGGSLADQGGDVVRPIGSVAKTMTALVTLRAHPLAAGEEGPTLTMTSDDVALFEQSVAQDGSAVAVTAGERLTERQLLLGLLLPSANNFAETLARWVSGDRVDFVVVLNRTALELGMAQTHFDDPSGLSPATVSTARDLAVLGGVALRDAALAQLVGTPRATLPDGGQISNIDTLVGTEPGWLGIKTGETPQAGACLLFAARRTPSGSTQPVTVIGAVLGQPALPDTFAAATRAVASAVAGYRDVEVAALMPDAGGRVGTAWGASAALRVRSPSPAHLLARAGDRAALTLTVAAPRGPALAAGSRVAEIEARRGPAVVATWSLVTDRAIAAPTAIWELLHG